MGEEVGTRFDVDPVLRDNDVGGLLFVARYDRERFYVEGTVGVREGRAVTENDYYPQFRTGTYGYFVSYYVANTIELRVLGARRPEASLFLDNPYYFETRNGAELRYMVGRRLNLRLSGQLGSNHYVNPVLVIETGQIVTRRDDSTELSGGFDFAISRAIAVGLTFSQDRYDSNIDYYDRKAFRISGGLRISAEFGRDEAEERR
jgi:hypothetical protein